MHAGLPDLRRLICLFVSLLFEREKAMIWANIINGASSGEFHSYLFGRCDVFPVDYQNSVHRHAFMTASRQV